MRKRTDPQLLKAIAGPDLSSVLSSWKEGARENIQEVLNEYDDLFMEHKGNIGRCKTAKHHIEREPGACFRRKPQKPLRRCDLPCPGTPTPTRHGPAP